MPQLQTPTIAGRFTTELEMARALFANGDHDDVLQIVDPLLLRDADDVSKFAAFQLKACVHSERQEWEQCLEVLRISGALLDEMPADLRAKYHGQRALAQRNLDQTDEALVEYEAARNAALEAGDDRIIATVRNNLATVYAIVGRVDEAVMEVDAAIRIVTRLGDDVYLGRCYDNKAQLLIAVRRYAEALTCSKRAVSLLAHHPANTEARTTHGLAMIGVGISYLDEPKTIEQYRARHDIEKELHVDLDVELIKTALKRANGQVLGAAKLLHVRHFAVAKLIDKHKLERSPKRRRAKSLRAK